VTSREQREASMTVSAQTPINSYLYAGSATFVYSFQILQAADLAVTVDGVAKTLGVDYTVSGVGVQTGGSITYISALTTGQRVTIARSTTLARTNDYQNEGDFLAATVNADFDQLWRALQDKDVGNQAFIRGQPGEVFAPLPTASTRAGYLLGFDGSGVLSIIAAAAQSATALALSMLGNTGATLMNFLQTGAGGLLRSVFSKLSDQKSVADFSSLAQAVADVNTNGGVLFFPRGSSSVSASLPNLHDIETAGNGSIVNGIYTWYMRPTNAQTNTIYLSTSGNDANDGIAPTQAVATLARALAIIASYGHRLTQGNWGVSVAAGTYSEGNVDFPVALSNRNRISITGPTVATPGVPTAIFDGTTGTKVYGLNFNSRALVSLSYLKFQNYTTYGVVGQDLGDLLTNNVHVATVPNGPGIKMQQGRLRVQGGIISACQTGINCIGGTTFTIGDPAGASLANGTQILNCTQQGILAQEQSSGHADFVTVTNCPVGLDATVRSRFHAAGCAITNSATAGVRCADGSSWFDNGTSANFSGNTANELMYAASGEIQREGSARTSETRLAVDQVFLTTTGVFAAAVVKTYAGDIAKNSFNSPIKAYKMIIRGTLAGVVNSKNITGNVAGSAWFGFTIPAGTVGDFIIEANLEAFGTSGTQQSYDARLWVNGAAAQVVQGSRGINMMTGAPIDVTILNTVNGAADTISIRAVNRYSWGGC
jgi:hypothetical protein